MGGVDDVRVEASVVVGGCSVASEGDDAPVFGGRVEYRGTEKVKIEFAFGIT